MQASRKRTICCGRGEHLLRQAPGANLGARVRCHGSPRPGAARQRTAFKADRSALRVLCRHNSSNLQCRGSRLNFQGIDDRVEVPGLNSAIVCQVVAGTRCPSIAEMPWPARFANEALLQLLNRAAGTDESAQRPAVTDSDDSRCNSRRLARMSSPDGGNSPA